MYPQTEALLMEIQNTEAELEQVLNEAKIQTLKTKILFDALGAILNHCVYGKTYSARRAVERIQELSQAALYATDLLENDPSLGLSESELHVKRVIQRVNEECNAEI